MLNQELTIVLFLGLFNTASSGQTIVPELAQQDGKKKEEVVNIGPLGGDTTVSETSRKAFTLSNRNLEDEHKSAFFLGNSLFNKNWTQAPSSASARDGLGPLFIARSCSGCHTQDGRGRPPEEGDDFVSLLFRASEHDEFDRLVPHHKYGGQIQTRSLSDEVKEPKIQVAYEEVKGAYPDGVQYTLQKPLYSLEGEKSTILSPRVAPAVVGLGLLEAIPEEILLSWADPEDKNDDGISGRVNRVLDVKSGEKKIGRFGWKSNQPNLAQQVASAFNGDIGITSSLFPDENSTAFQKPRLMDLPSGGDPEISDRLIDSVVLYCKTLAVPAQRESKLTDVREGQALFTQANCVACHKPEVMTGDYEIASLAQQKIHPFTDLLIHDMGEGLADNRPDGEANGREWRTPPLWGIGLVETVNKHTRFLHDGRARNIEEAILWHGGEAEASKNVFKSLSRKERDQLLVFIRSL